jgi:hypothetical protein
MTISPTYDLYSEGYDQVGVRHGAAFGARNQTDPG